MCGIIAVVRRPSTRAIPDIDSLIESITDLASLVRDGADPTTGLREAADRLFAADTALRGVPGLQLMLSERSLTDTIAHHVGSLGAVIETLESGDDADTEVDTAELERRNHELGRVRDGMWALCRDRIRAADAVSELAGDSRTSAAIEGYLSIHQALSALDRLEVRGRDSAGLHVLVHDHALDLGDLSVQA